MVAVTLKTRMPVGKLRKKHFEAFPIWEYADDEEGNDGMDETWVRPVNSTIVQRRSYCHVAADFSTPGGKTFFGFGFYDDDFVESYLQPGKEKATVYEQLKYLSYSSSFIEQAVAEAQKRKLEETSFVFLMYNFAYDPKVTKIQRDDYLEFLGVFTFDQQSDSAVQWQG